MTERDLVFPLSRGSYERPALQPPRLTAGGAATAGIVMGHASFLRAWAVRRAKVGLSPAPAGAAPQEFLREPAVNLR